MYINILHTCHIYLYVSNTHSRTLQQNGANQCWITFFLQDAVRTQKATLLKFFLCLQYHLLFTSALMASIIVNIINVINKKMAKKLYVTILVFI